MSNDSTRLQTILCGCCWPSRSKDQHLPEPHKGPDVYEFAVFKQFTNPNEQAVEIVRQPPVKPINLSANHLPRIVVTSSTSSQLTTSDDADYESLAEFVTARTSRSSHGDECRFRSMPELVEEIRSELLGRNFEDVKQEFVTFFRGEPQKSQLTSVPPKSIEDEPEVTSSVAPYPSDPTVLFNSKSIIQTPTETARPIRPFVSRLQLSSARISERAHNTVYFFYWCLAFGIQKVLGDPPIDS